MTLAPSPRRVPTSTDRRLSIALLTVGLLATIGVVVVVINWASVMGDTLHWAKWMLLAVQIAIFAVSLGLCVVRLRTGKVGYVVPLIGGVIATLFFWIAGFLLVASLPCPSFC
jgi:hypothetical protein